MRSVKKLSVLQVILFMLLAAASASAAVSVPSIIGDHMVLQAGKPLPIWGKADPGESVSVTFMGNSVKAVADADGKWMVKMPKLPRTGVPAEMTIAGKDNVLTIKDILVGEVWIGSGQSNMQWSVKDSNNAREEMAAARFPEIRLFYVERTVASTPQYDCKGEWKACAPDTIPDFSAVLYFFGRDLHQKLGSPVGLICSAWGGTPAESWVSRGMLESKPELDVIVKRWDKLVVEYPEAKMKFEAELETWRKEAERAKAAGQPEPKRPDAPRGPDHPWLASGLFNSMIAPLVPFAVQGAVWYQGESNADRAYQYRTLFPSLIQDWRNVWKQGPLSFYFVQLANFTETKPEPGESTWAELREAQTMTLNVENTGMAVIIDIGEAKDIHPRNKQDVGQRLALNALAKDYGEKVVWSGPMFESVKIEGREAIVRFSHADGGLVAKGAEPLKGFAVAGSDKKFVWAEAKIKGDTIIVSSPEVAKPVGVRYAWAHNPICNLYNGAGLPASPFRTDQWPGETVNNKVPAP